MGASDMLNKGSFDIDEVMMDRNNRVNQPDFSPGMDDFDSFFQSSSESNNGGMDIFGGGDNSLGLGGNEGLGLGGSGFGLSSPNLNSQQQQKSEEDKFFEVIVGIGKTFWDFFKDISGSFKGLTPKFWSVWGSRTLVTSLVLSVIGLILMLFGLSWGIQLTIGALISSAFGVGVLMSTVDKAKSCTSQYKDSNNAQPQNDFDLMCSDNQDTFDYDDYDDNGGDTDDYFDYSDYDDTPETDLDLTASDMSDLNFSTFGDTIEKSDVNTVISNLDSEDIPTKGMYTRQYLYSMLSRVLPSITPNYNNVKSIEVDSEVGVVWEKYLRDSAEATGIKEEFLPELLKLEEN